ncbi:MAG: hypothetical protein KAV87_61040, partial [Desulfobacteraceae bacterium]|nr:hypothetical protein [Desulfobacteraceae bacterium]
MTKKNSRFSRIPNYFTPPGAHNPIGNIIAEGANIVVHHGMDRLSREAAKLMGLSTVSIDAQLSLNRSRLMLAKQEGDNMRAQRLGEKQLRILDLKIEEKEIEIEKRKQLLEETMAQRKQLASPITEVVSGALEITADAEGLSGSPEQSEAYNRWLDGFQEGKVIVIVGRRGSGKSVLAAKMGEYMMATYRMACYWVGLPDQAKALIPSWIKIVDDPHKCPVGSFIITDEAGI